MRLRCAILTSLLMILPIPAFADIISTFTLQDVTFEEPSFGEHPSATGTLTFDVTTEEFTAVDVMVGFGGPPVYEFTSIASNEFSNLNTTSYGGAFMKQGDVSLALVWNGLGDICTETNPCGPNNNDGISSSLITGYAVFDAKTGSVTATTSFGTPPALMPEPSTIVLLSSGILGLIAMAYRRRTFASHI
jgi:hypothetical protein